MKVNVIAIEDAKFKRLHWWSDWIDVVIYDFCSRPYLLQMSVSRANAKKFKSVCITGIFYKQCLSSTVGDLIQMKAKS